MMRWPLLVSPKGWIKEVVSKSVGFFVFSIAIGSGKEDQRVKLFDGWEPPVRITHGDRIFWLEINMALRVS
ncbi:MAG: hypothetical protein D3917_08605 [Candidatus Electrothrix sp. AX5]|nr:hypothetical protein [Candidatus Electrothrix sp. AX5]